MVLKQRALLSSQQVKIAFFPDSLSRCEGFLLTSPKDSFFPQKSKNGLFRVLCVQNQNLLVYCNNLFAVASSQKPLPLGPAVENCTLQCVFSVSDSLVVLKVFLIVHFLSNCLRYHWKVLAYQV